MLLDLVVSDLLVSGFHGVVVGHHELQGFGNGRHRGGRSTDQVPEKMRMF